MFLYIILSLFTFTTFSQSSFEISDIVITDKLERSKSEVFENISILSSKDLKKFSSTEEALSSFPGLYVTSSGGQSSLSFRGLGQEHVLVLLNGVRLNDHSSITTNVNLVNINLSEVDRIEVIRGASGVQYGGSSIGAVINLITKKYSPGYVKLISGFKDKAELSFSKLYGDSSLRLTGFFERDDSLSRKKGSEVDRKISRGFNLAWSVERAELDFDFVASHGNNFADDDSFSGDSSELFTKTKMNSLSTSIKGKRASFIANYSHTKRESKTNPPAVDEFESKSLEGDFNYKLSKRSLLGLQAQKIESKSENKEKDIHSLYFILGKNIRGLELELGGRYEKDSSFDDEFLYSTAFKKSWNQNNITRFLVKTGYKAPSFYQLYTPTYGNKNLIPEEGISYELSHIIESFLTLETTLFVNQIKNSIIFDSTYKNDQNIYTQGIELLISKKINRTKFSFGGVFTDFRSRDVKRRPKVKLNGKVDYELSDSLNASLSLKHIGSRVEFSNVKLDSYELVDISFSKKYKSIETSLFINNILDEKYEDIENFQTLGFNYLVQLKYLY